MRSKRLTADSSRRRRRQAVTRKKAATNNRLQYVLLIAESGQPLSIASRTFSSRCPTNCPVVFSRTLQVMQPGTTTPFPPCADEFSQTPDQYRDSSDTTWFVVTVRCAKNRLCSSNRNPYTRAKRCKRRRCKTRSAKLGSGNSLQSRTSCDCDTRSRGSSVRLGCVATAFI
jgi:hypothetical protein